MNSLQYLRKTATAFLMLSALSVTGIQGQVRNAAYESYIKKYADMAVEQMEAYGVPASITLAQGLLESAAGQSTLAKASNNHFGIKCGSSWQGESVRHDDDARNECFRAYDKVSDSYKDHSLFLRDNRRYSSLFDLSKTDYKGWAVGLKKAGYATNPSYANSLIGIIEEYGLYKYDGPHLSKSEQKKLEKELKKKPWLRNPHMLYLNCDLVYTVARDGDTFQLLAKELGVSKKKLMKYNEVEEGYTLQDGDMVYLGAKNKRSVSEDIYYDVKEGDSMHSIAQKYAVTLKTLYKLNRLKNDYQVEVGERIFLK